VQRLVPFQQCFPCAASKPIQMRAGKEKEGNSCGERELWNNLTAPCTVLFLWILRAQKYALVQVPAELASNEFENRATSCSSADKRAGPRREYQSNGISKDWD